MIKDKKDEIMVIEKVDTLVVGAGQAGIAASEHLSNHGIQHVVLERDRIAEKWISARWDSLVSNGPAWHDRFPSRNFDDPNHDAFISKEGVARVNGPQSRKMIN